MGEDKTKRTVAVIGGGISGLAAAYQLTRERAAGREVKPILIEASPRLGGVIQTETFEGFILEGGPDSFLSAKPQAAELARELGLGEALLGSSDGDRRTYVLHHGRLMALPDGLFMMVPTRIAPFATTRLLSAGAKMRACAEYFMRPSARNGEGDQSVERFVTRHFGRAVFQDIAEPLLAGVYGGDAAEMSAQSVLPTFWAMERTHGSLMRGTLALRKRRNRTGAAPPLFTTFREGMEQLVRALARTLDPAQVICGRKVISLTRESSSAAPRWRIGWEGGGMEVDAVILAMPAPVCARLLESVDASLASQLAAASYTPAIVASFGFDEPVALQLPPGHGLLVPRKENRKLLACTFVHRKFPGRAPEGKSLLRCFFGTVFHPELTTADDETIVRIARDELNAILGIRSEPMFQRVFRSPASMAQYRVGHADWLKTVEQRLETVRGLYLAGNGYRGIGISDCIVTGFEAAREAVL